MDKKKNDKKYVCEVCDFSTFKKADYNRHILTLKHKNAISDKKENKNEKLYTCICGKSYKYCSGLSKHKKNCKNKNSVEIKTDRSSIEEKLELVEKISIQTANYLSETRNYLSETRKSQNVLTALIVEKLGNIEERLKNLENNNIL
tara:strand:- start:96 stop:533 length:438 start_codon:yes stop_codon:yes gene_type:complete